MVQLEGGDLPMMAENVKSKKWDFSAALDWRRNGRPACPVRAALA
jgi:hypothetical protein